MTTSQPLAISVAVDGGKSSVSCTAPDLVSTFAWMLKEMRSVARVLRPDERELLRTIMTRTGPSLTVRDIFPAFSREDEAHKTLRRLRATQFVYPARTGRWQPDEPVAVTPFARLVWDQLGETGTLPPTGPAATNLTPPPAPAAAPTVSDAPAATSEDPVLKVTPPPRPVTWDNLVECVRERQEQKAAEARATK